MHLEAEIVQLRNALGGHDWASLEMHMHGDIKLNAEMHLVAVIERV